jgi:hypothetical protein
MIAHMRYLKVLRKHFTSGFPSPSDKVQRIVVQRTRKDNCDHGHGRHEPNWWGFGTSNRTINQRAKTICKRTLFTPDHPGKLTPSM